MFEISLNLLEQNVRKNHYSSMRIDDIYDYISVEGHLTLVQDGQEIFSADVAAIEFFWYISKWYRSESIKRKWPFEYSTVEYFKSILTFSYYREGLWKIDSPWMRSGSSLIVEERVLALQVQKLVCHLAESLEKEE